MFFCKKKLKWFFLRRIYSTGHCFGHCFVVDPSFLHQSINQSLNNYLCQYVGWVCLNHPHQRLMYETYDNKLTFVKFCLPSVVIIDHSETNRPTSAPDQILERLNITRMEFLLLRHTRLFGEMSPAARARRDSCFPRLSQFWTQLTFAVVPSVCECQLDCIVHAVTQLFSRRS